MPQIHRYNLRSSIKWSNLLGAGLFLVSSQIHAQCLNIDLPDSLSLQIGGQQAGGGGGPYLSQNGKHLPTWGTLRVLVVLAEVDGVVGSNEWPAHQMPVWVDNLDPEVNLFDWDVPNGTATGLLTRYFQDASSGTFTVLADYLVPPENYGADIFQVSSASTSAVIAEVNQAWGTTLATAHNFTSVSDFDMWETNTANTGPGQPKTPGMEVAGVYDHVMFIFQSGSWDTGSAYDESPGMLLGHEANTYSICHAHHGIPIDIVRHEFSHLLYGGNNFHTGGGGHNSGSEYFITHGNGWSNMGLSGASINSWNAWDR